MDKPVKRWQCRHGNDFQDVVRPCQECQVDPEPTTGQTLVAVAVLLRLQTSALVAAHEDGGCSLAIIKDLTGKALLATLVASSHASKLGCPPPGIEFSLRRAAAMQVGSLSKSSGYGQVLGEADKAADDWVAAVKSWAVTQYDDL